MKLFSPAKLNLFLHVLGKREDGYHNLASLFQAVSLGDYLDFSLSDKDTLILKNSIADLPEDGSNLIFKAANLFRKKTGLSFGLSVNLEKNIPLQAGLGGGSSNAATTLWALNELFNRPATLNDLIEWSAELGSDITFFLSCGTAYCTGRGEIIEPLEPIEQKDTITIVKPDFGLATEKVFKALNISCLSFIDPKIALRECLLGQTYFNDLEQPAFLLEPRLLKIKEALLNSGFKKVVMTGSGTAFFCIGEGKTTMQHFKVNFIHRKQNEWYIQNS